MIIDHIEKLKDRMSNCLSLSQKISYLTRILSCTHQLLNSPETHDMEIMKRLIEVFFDFPSSETEAIIISRYQILRKIEKGDYLMDFEYTPEKESLLINGVDFNLLLDYTKVELNYKIESSFKLFPMPYPRQWVREWSITTKH